MKRFSGDISIVLGGAAGQGIQTVEAMLVSVLKAEGYRIFACKEYMSRIRGGSNSTEIRIGRGNPLAYVERIDFLLALDQGVIPHLRERIGKQTIILGEKDKVQHEGAHIIDLPFTKLSAELGNPIFASTIAVGAVLGMLGAERKPFEDYLRAHFARKGEDVVKKNLEAAAKGMDFGSHIAFMEGFEVNLQKDETVREELLLDGNTALGLGAIAAGCDFASSYPMSPGTGVLTYLASQAQKFGIVIDQAEDEIAAINIAIGAWYAGARALVTTSGGGFALMCEGVSLAGMIETPVVVHIGQRPGPATGLPTRTEQADLNLVLYAGHGEFPRAIFAPGTPAQAFHAMQQAFEAADAYQIPVFVLSDQYMLDSISTLPKEDLECLPVIKHVVETDAAYRRYVVTEDGISPRGIPGFGQGMVGVDSDEHDEEAHITESALVRIAMHEKRLRKLDLMKESALMPEEIEAVKGAKTLIVTWGSNRGILEEALGTIKDESVAGLHFCQVYPLNPKAKKLFSKKRIIVMENNAAGQFADLLERDLDIEVSERILKYDGSPYSVEETVERLKQLL
ncbi:MAG: 2-oxoacid:acceptor oxidoreductase subunit alpha [Candidatus Moranbacteria bacterium]|nr:2-oxoacid:acceptor oxidoreductase subunit alpha [Candidatus Moranbacteria bacterium]MBP6034050.1 2-oxoacid:acceptor oxidoreductase subunit alpha [Candidatus Moranbacteria bacterium]MBP7696119.1 2-oxoacid:acceptor oxidoreductase subunit alpha [Candidatus Moranbacteria bacterium]